MPRQIEVQVLLNDTAARTKMTSLDSDLTAMTRKTYRINLDLGNATAQIRAFEAAVKSLNTALSSMSGMSGSGGGAVKLAKDLGVSIATLNPMISGNTNAIRTWIHTLTGFGDATVKAAGNLRTTADSFQRFEVTTQNAAGGLNTFVYSINEATGEVFRLDTGVKDSIGNMDRASIAAQRMGVQFSGTLTPGIASSLASMTAFIHAQSGMGSAIVQATGSVTNAAGRWQQFTAAVTQADGSIHTVRYSVNTATNEMRTLDLGIKNGSQAFTTAAQAAEHLGTKLTGTIPAGSRTSLAAVTAFIQGLTGMSAATVQYSGAVNNAAGHWQQYTASVTTADGANQTFTYSVNAATGEIRQLDTGVKQASATVNKAAQALAKMGTSVGTVGVGSVKSLAEMTRFIQGMKGLEGSTVKAKGNLTNAAGTFQVYEASVKQADGSIQVFRFHVNEATGQVLQLDKGVKSASLGFSSLTSKAGQFIKTMLGFTGVAMLIRQTFTELKKVDSELTNYIKVTGASAQQSQVILAQAYDSAIKYGISAESMMSGISAFARAGYKDSATELAGVSAQLQLVGGMAAEDADSFLIAADAAYKLGGSLTELNALVNYATVIDNNYATTIDNVAEGFTRIASVAAVSGTAVKELMAALGTISASQQWGGDVTGTALRAIFLAINKDTISEIEEGETVSVDAVNSMDDAINTFAKDELEAAQAAGKILDPMKALGALAKSYKGGLLTDSKLYEIANSFGGKRYTNALVGLIQNWDMYESMLSDMESNTSAADNAMSAALDSWDAKLNRLKTTWQQMFSESGSTGIVKWAIDGARDVLVFCDSLENLIGLVGGLVVAVKTASAAITASIEGKAAIAKTNWIIAAISAVIAALSAMKSAIDSAKTAANNALSNGSSLAAQNIEKLTKSVEKDTKTGIELIKEYKALADDGIDSSEIEKVRDLQQEIKEILGDQADLVDLINGNYVQNEQELAQYLAQKNTELIQQANTAMANFLLDVNGNTTYETGPFTRSAFRASSGSLGTGFYMSPDEADWFERNVIGNIGGITGKRIDDHGFDIGTFLLPNYQTIEQAVEDWNAINDIMTQMANTTDGNGIYLSTKYSAVYAALSEYSAALEPVMQKIAAAQEQINDATAQNIVLESDLWKATYESAEARDQAIEALIASHTELTEDQKNAAREFAKSVTTIEEAEQPTEALAEGFNELKAAIEAATKAKQQFDEANKTTKADGAKGYIEAYKALMEENEAGRYNSTRAHAAYRMLMGDDAYNATGGNVSQLMAAFGGSADAWKTLTGSYTDQNGRALEGFGLYKLAQQYGGIGLSRDVAGNIKWDFSDGNLEQISARSGIGMDILRVFANAMDQYDKEGQADGGQTEDPNVTAVNNATSAVETATAAINGLTTALGGGNGGESGAPAGGETQTNAEIVPEVDEASRMAAEKKMADLTKPGEKTITIKTIENTPTQTAATGKKYSSGGPTLVNDGSGQELIVDNGRAYIANGGDPAIVNLGRGAKVYTAEQTRRILFESGIRSAAMGLDTLANGPGYSYANYLNGLGDGITDVIEAVLEGEGEGEGEGEEEKKKGGGGGGNKPSAKGSWDKLTKIIPYILNRVNRALEKQSEIIDKQIQALEDEKNRKEQQNQLEEYQKAVLDAENDLNEAMTNRTVRYLDDNGQWHWMADAKAVQEAQKALDDSKKELQDYLEELTYEAQVKTLENEKERLSDEYSAISDYWNEILEQYETPTGDLAELLKTIQKSGDATQKNAANVISQILLPMLTGGSFTGNYDEALAAVAAATGKKGALMPGLDTDEQLAALIASSGTTIGSDAMLEALKELAGPSTIGKKEESAGGAGTQDTYYYINGVHIGNDIAELPLSEVLERLSLFTNN